MHCLLDAHKRVCKHCNQIKPLTDFPKHKDCILGRQPKCKACNYERVKDWYNKNRKRRQDISNERLRKRKQAAIKRFGNKCADCANSFADCVYDFHHVDGTKEMNPSHAFQLSEKRMLEELNKCTMLCANCHRLRHFARID